MRLGPSELPTKGSTQLSPSSLLCVELMVADHSVEATGKRSPCLEKTAPASRELPQTHPNVRILMQDAEGDHEMSGRNSPDCCSQGSAAMEHGAGDCDDTSETSRDDSLLQMPVRHSTGIQTKNS